MIFGRVVLRAQLRKQGKERKNDEVIYIGVLVLGYILIHLARDGIVKIAIIHEAT